MNREFIFYTAFVFAIVFMIIGAVRTIKQPVSLERQFLLST